jgi:hypothetical protein
VSSAWLGCHTLLIPGCRRGDAGTDRAGFLGDEFDLAHTSLARALTVY